MRQCLAVALIWASAATADGPAQHLQSLTWSIDHPRFGGWSGFEFHDNGTRFSALSDRGAILTGTLHRDAGRIASITAEPPVPLRDPQGNIPKRNHTDSEGLAIAPDGTRYASFEGIHRVRDVTDIAKTANLPANGDFADFAPNASLEALAVDAEGALYTLPEKSGQLTRAFPVFRYANGAWSRFGTIPRLNGFLPVGADFGPDGRFYLLERGFNGLGFRTRIRRFERGPEGFENAAILLTSRTAQHDNLEGIAIWQAEDGLRATMISDDNFRSVQRTEIVEYRLPD